MAQLTHCFLLAAVFTGAGFLASCGGGSQSAGATEPEPAQASTAPPAERLAGMFEKLARDIEANPSCDHYASVVNAFVDAHSAELRNLITEVETRSHSAASPEPYRELQRRLVDSMEVVIQQSAACHAHADAQAAFAAFDQMMSSV